MRLQYNSDSGYEMRRISLDMKDQGFGFFEHLH